MQRAEEEKNQQALAERTQVEQQLQDHFKLLVISMKKDVIRTFSYVYCDWDSKDI